MKIIKLNATDSTNSFLKEMSKNTRLESYTVVTASYQKKGKGQLGNQWFSEPNKNLLCSVFVRFNDVHANQQVSLNYAVSLAVFTALKKYDLLNLQIKWPNDILSQNQKICGLLIESVIKKEKLVSAIIGIGINANQTHFSKDLNRVSSIKNIIGKEINLDDLLTKIVESLKKQLDFLSESSNTLKQNYLRVLYKKDVPAMFKNKLTNLLFMGKIIGVSDAGNLQVQFEDDSVKEFELKTISFA